MRILDAGDGDRDAPHADAYCPLSLPSTHSPLGPQAASLQLDEDLLEIDANTLEEFLDEWEPKTQSPDPPTEHTEAHRWSARLDSAFCRRSVAAAVGEVRKRKDSESKSSKTPMGATRASKKQRTSSNTWWKRQRKDLLELREAVTVLILELESLKLDHGIKSTLPSYTRVPVTSVRLSPEPLTICPPGASWREVTQHESLARQDAEGENERLRGIVASQMKYAHKLRRALTRTVETDGIVQALGVPLHFLRPEAQRPPQDNGVVFARLLAGLDNWYANADKVLTTSKFANLPCPGQTSHKWVDKVQCFHAEILDRYRVPFDDQHTAPAIWNVLTACDLKADRVLYAEIVDYDANTSLTCQRKLYEAGSRKIELLMRVACRKYVDRGRTVYVQHRSVLTNPGDQHSMSFDEVTTRILMRSELQTYALGTSMDGHKANQYVPDSFERWHHSLTRLNHMIEDVALANSVRNTT